MSEPGIGTGIHEPLRTWATILTLSRWPAEEGGRLSRAIHAQTRRLATHLADPEFREHPLVLEMNTELATGRPPEKIAAAWFSSPDRAYEARLAAFAKQGGLPAYWTSQAPVWTGALADLTAVLSGSPAGSLLRLLGALRGRPLTVKIEIMPNLLFPALRGLPVRRENRLWALVPPPQAWGESPPWDYQEDVEWTLTQICRSFLHDLFGDRLETMTPRERALFEHAVVALLLEIAIEAAAGRAYLLRCSRQHDLPELTDCFEALRSGWAAGEIGRPLRSMFPQLG